LEDNFLGMGERGSKLKGGRRAGGRRQKPKNFDTAHLGYQGWGAGHKKHALKMKVSEG